MFKKIGLVLIVLLLVAIGFVWVKVLMPLQESADKNGPASAGRDYALRLTAHARCWHLKAK